MGWTRTDLGVVELHGVVRGQRHTQAFVEELSERVLVVLKEQAVVTERRHGDGHLAQVIQVLQHGTLGEREGNTREVLMLKEVSDTEIPNVRNVELLG